MARLGHRAMRDPSRQPPSPSLLSCAFALRWVPSLNLAVNRPPHHGSAHTPILVFSGIVGLSVVFFFIFSAGHLTRNKPAPAVAEQTSPAAPEKAPPATVEPVTTPDPQSTLPAGIPQSAYFTTADALVKAVAERAASGKAEDLAPL